MWEASTCGHPLLCLIISDCTNNANNSPSRACEPAHAGGTLAVETITQSMANKDASHQCLDSSRSARLKCRRRPLLASVVLGDNTIREARCGLVFITSYLPPVPGSTANRSPRLLQMHLVKNMLEHCNSHCKAWLQTEWHRARHEQNRIP